MSGQFFDIPLVDHHCHAIVEESRKADVETMIRVTSEAPRGYSLADLRQRLAWHAVVEIVSRFSERKLVSQPSIEEVTAVLQEVDYNSYCQRLFASARYEELYVDTGFAPASAMSLEAMAQVTSTRTYSILRLEQLAEAEFQPGRSFDEWWEAVRSGVESARNNGYIGAKSIVAYRCGLNLHTVSREDAMVAYRHWTSSNSNRLTDPSLLNFLVWESALTLARQSLPLQFHSGYGDPDTDLLLGNPLHLRGFLEAFTPHGLSVVLLHTYPYHREAGYLASVYNGVYFDTSLIIPLGPSAARRVVSEALELAPYSRYLFASDAHTRPELFTLAAELFRDGFAVHLDDSLVSRYTSTETREIWARQVMRDNARKLYLGMES